MEGKENGRVIPENMETAPNGDTKTAQESNIQPRGLSSKKNIVIIALAGVLALGIGGTAAAVGISNTSSNRISRYMGAAERYLSEQNYEQAIIEFQRILEIDPMNADAYLGMAEAYIALGDIDNAIETLRTGLEQTDDDRIREQLNELLLAQALENGQLYLSEKNYPQAESEFSNALEIDEKSVEAYIGKADSHIGAEDFTQAVGSLQKGYDLTNDSTIKEKLDDLKLSEALKHGQEYLTAEKYPQAECEFSSALEINEKCVEAYIGKADSHIGNEDFDKAVEALRMGVENTGNKSIKTKLIELLSDCANKYLVEKNYAKAIEQLVQIIKIDDKNVGAYISLAESYMSMNNADKAIEILEKGFANTNDNSVKNKLVSVLTQSANRSLSEKKYELALTSFKKLTDIAPENSSAYIGTANAYIGLEQNDAAVKVLQDGYDKTKNSKIKNMLVERLLVFAATLPAEQSIAEFQKILELDDLQKNAYVGLANAYKELAQNEKAIEVLQTGYDKTGDTDIKNLLNEFLYGIKPLSAEMFTTTEISVRTEPDITSEKVGSLGKGEAVTVTGKANNGWCRIAYKNGKYFVNGEYLSTSKPVVPEPTSAPANTAEALLNSVVLHPQKTGDALLDPLVESILARITNSNMSTYEKVKACYDYAINNFSYGQGDGYIGWGIKGWAYEVLTSNIGVCNNYSSAFAVMTRAIGLETYLQNGQTSSSKGGFTGHTWCTIMINGVPYLFDPQVEDNIAKGGAISYFKFCKPYDSGTGKDNYIPSDDRYYLENETSVNGDLLIEPDGTTVWPDGIGGSWWVFF